MLRSNRYIQRLTQTLVISEKNARDQRPPSLPTPEFLTPPNGVRKSLCSHVLTQTIPLSTRLANRLPLSASSVQMEPANPYSVQLAISIASSSVAKE